MPAADEATLPHPLPSIGTQSDCLLAAVAEHIAISDGPVPDWCDDPQRSLQIYCFLLENYVDGFPGALYRETRVRFCDTESSSAARNSVSAKKSENMAPLSASDSCDALRRSSEEVARRKIEAHADVVGGAVMALGCDFRRLAHDADAFIRERRA